MFNWTAQTQKVFWMKKTLSLRMKIKEVKNCQSISINQVRRQVFHVAAVMNWALTRIIQQESLDPSKVRKVRLLYQSGNAMVIGSDWIAHAMVLTGQALAQGIAR